MIYKAGYQERTISNNITLRPPGEGWPVITLCSCELFVPVTAGNVIVSW